MIECKNCNNEFDGNYCNQCGQSAATRRINFKFLWHDIQHGLLHFDKGIIYSLGQLCLRPGHTINEYMAGKRVGHFKPLSMVVVLATVYGLLKHFFIHEEAIKESSKIVINNTRISVSTVNAIIEWVNNHGAIMALIVVPFYALASFLVYREEKYNYVEHLVLNAYTSSLRLLVTIILFPLVVLTQHTSGADTVDTATNVLELAVTGWCFIQFFSNIKWFTALKKLISTYLIFFVEMIVVGIILIAIFVTFIYHGKA